MKKLHTSSPIGVSEVSDVSEILTFLLVEDNKIALFSLERLVVQIGCQFISVMDGEVAFDLAKNKTFNLIITDLGLPGLSGIELTSKIRAFEKEMQKKPAPIIGLTAHSQEETKQACLKSGMNEVFTKPMTFELLSTLVRNYFPETSIASIVQ